MRNIIYLTLFVLFLFSCKKDRTPVPPPGTYATMIIGHWSLKQQHVVVNANGSKMTDTTYNPSSDDYVDMDFNANNAFSNIKYYSTGNGSIGQGALVGFYAVQGTLISMTTDGIWGLRNGDPAFSDAVPGAYPAILDSGSIAITQLTATSLVFHLEYTYSYNYTQSFKVASDYSFTKF